MHRFNFCNVCNVVTSFHVVRENRSRFAPGSKAALDQSAAALQPGFLLDQGADLRFAIAHRLRECAMSEPLGMLEPGHGHVHDCRRPLHARVRILRGYNS